MPYGLKRLYGRGHLHFITFSCCRRQPFLDTPAARSVFLKELDRLRTEYGFLLVGYVVMPEHVHLLISEPQHGTPSTVLKMLKQRVSHQMKTTISPPGELRQFWSARFHDFNVFTERKKTEKLKYIHGNPVSRGLVDNPAQWPWSRRSNYATRGSGLIEVDLM